MPIWASWISFPIGVWLLFLTIRDILRHGWKFDDDPEPENLDAEIAQAKAKLDAMYLQEHGQLPEKSKDED